ncbi:MAG: response regulator [Desulfobacteraceae bacterium]|nr:response regulator [Desulfobacteraceae bacterium]
MSKNKIPLDLENLSILVVDDMKSMRLTVREMLKNLNIGVTLRFAENGKEGLAVLRGSKIDLAIIDWNMPVMNGVTMLGEIRKDVLLRDMPVIMITAEAERDIVSEVAETEINGYLLKPLTLGALDKTIKAVIKKANNPDPLTIHRKQARGLEEKGDFQAAIEQIKTALTYKPSASRLLRHLGLLHFKIKKNSIAEKCLLKAVSVNRQDTISRVYLADYYLKKNKLQKAGNYYLEILSLSTKYNEKAYDIGKKLLRNNLRPLALDIFSKVIARSKTKNAAREQIIDICLSNNEREYPLTLLDQGIKENPSNYDMIYKAGLIVQDAGDLDKALKYFIKVDRHVRGHTDAKFQIAKIYYMNRKILKADDYLNQILRIDPSHEEAIALRREI